MAGAGAARAGPRERARAASVLRGLARFAEVRGVPAGWACLLDYNVIEAFCVAGLADRVPSTQGTYRSVLYQLASPVHGEPGCRATPFPGAKAPAPYSPDERAGLAAAAGAQRGPVTRASALAMVVFGIGAGLRPGTQPGSSAFDRTPVHSRATAKASTTSNSLLSEYACEPFQRRSWTAG